MRWAALPKAARLLPPSISLLVLFHLPARSIRAAEPRANRRVLILYEAGTDNPGSNLIDQGIRTALGASPYKLEVHREYMDTPLFPDPADQLRFREFYIRKYQNHRPDVIITVGPSPLKFVIETRNRGFPGVPVIFCFPQWGYGVDPPLPSDFTGVEADLAAFETVQAALRLQPDTRHIVVVGGAAYFDAQAEALIKEQLRPYEKNFDLSYLTNLTMPDLLDRLKHLPSHTIVLLSAFSQDAAGTKFVFSSESAPIIAAAANAPVFSTTDSALTHGQVGGKVTFLEQAGETAGGMALRILKGERPQDIPRVKGPTIYTWDWLVLKRWGLEEKDLPPGSIVLNRQPSLWELYWRYVVAGVFLLSAQAVIILGLMWQRALRRKALTRLAAETNELQAREELLKAFVEHVPAGVAMLDRDMRYLQVSERWCADYGVESSELIGKSHYDIFPDMPEHWRDVHRRGLAGETIRSDEDPWDRECGTIWVRWEIRPWWNRLDALPGGILIFAEDITHRKEMEEDLSRVSQKLIEAHEEERTRIARELHDDVNQRLAILAVSLDKLQMDFASSPAGLRKGIEEASRQTMDLTSDVQALSHRLHSSKLDILGLSSAAAGFCREVSKQRGVDVQFQSENIPKNLPKEVSLCLFRVLQEALQNGIKHSGSRRFEVHLSNGLDEIELRVSDSGVGFDAEEALKSAGIGLTSMTERLKLVNGTLSITSKPQRGTTVFARVPRGPEPIRLPIKVSAAKVG